MVAAFAVVAILWLSPLALGQVLDKDRLLERQTFWDNRDWDWYKQNIPFFECPNEEINTTYYYRWEVVTKHLTYGSANSGYSFTEFIDRPFWSGAYGAISCPAGHQIYEVRWLRDPRFARDYSRYWFRTSGAQPRRYSCWLGDSVWALHQAHPDDAFIVNLLPDLVANYEAWERAHDVPDLGLFWQTGHDDGMEININSRQTQDVVRGAPGYRPTLNSYLWADAKAIERIARLADDDGLADRFATKAAAIKISLQQRLWDPQRQFFFHMYRQDEHRDGHKIEALSLTHQTGRFAGSPHGRELIGYVPWQFNLPDPGFEAAWKFLMNPEYFAAPFGPTTVERRDPLFHLSKTCCWWSGQSWPYATTQTLVAMANLLNHYEQSHVSKSDYVKLLETYTRTHRKDGRPYIAEAAHPDTGSWEGHDNYNHSEHYFHSAYNDCIITGLIGLRPREDDEVEVNPLAPDEWDYFAIDDVAYRGRRLSVLWDRTGDRYGFGRGLHVLVDGKSIARSERLQRIVSTLPPASRADRPRTVRTNFAVNNDGHYFPRATASYSHSTAPPAKATDGNYWYHLSPPNRWTTEGSPNDSDEFVVEFGTDRRMDTVKLYWLDDGMKIVPPGRVELEYWLDGKWTAVPNQRRSPVEPAGRRANVIEFAPLETNKFRAMITHAANGRSGLSEFEIWGEATLPVEPAGPPPGNLALRTADAEFPRATASFTSRFDRVDMANDGVINFNPAPHNRWTSYESPNASDWLEIDFGEPQRIGRVELAIYDDRGGVQAPTSYAVHYWKDGTWRDVANPKRLPEQPAGGQINQIQFEPVQTNRVRIVFEHRGKARSGVSEIFVWSI